MFLSHELLLLDFCFKYEEDATTDADCSTDPGTRVVIRRLRHKTFTVISRNSHISIALGRHQALRLFLFRSLEPPSCLFHVRESIETWSAASRTSFMLSFLQRRHPRVERSSSRMQSTSVGHSFLTGSSVTYVLHYPRSSPFSHLDL